MASVEREKFKTMSEAAPKRPPSDAHLDWVKVTMSRVKSVPDLLVVRSVPHVNRMLSTVAEKVTAEAASADKNEKADNVK